MSGTVELCMTCHGRLILQVVVAYAAVVTLIYGLYSCSRCGTNNYSNYVFSVVGGTLSSMMTISPNGRSLFFFFFFYFTPWEWARSAVFFLHLGLNINYKGASLCFS